MLRSRLKERRSKKEKTKAKKGRTKKVDTKPAEPKIDRRRKPFFTNDLSETLFTITDLTFEEQVAEIDKRKESANYKNGVFKCEECYKGFLDEDAYNSHMSRHTDVSMTLFEVSLFSKLKIIWKVVPIKGVYIYIL